MGGFNESVESSVFSTIKQISTFFDESKKKDDDCMLIGGYKESIYSKLDKYKYPKYELNSHDKEIIEELFKEEYEESDISFKSTNKNINKKLQLNILYYDESLKDNEENSDNCTFLQMNTNGTFYGCHNLDLLQLVLNKIKNTNKEFILLSSGSSAEKIYPYCLGMKEIFIV